jgi:hypothetical protein
MSLPFFYLLDVVLLSRLILTFNDEAMTSRQAIIMAVVQVAGLAVFQINAVLLAPLLVLALLNALSYFAEQRWADKTNESRLLSLLVQIIAISILTSAWLGLTFSPGLPALIARLGGYTTLFKFDGTQVKWPAHSAVLLGLLLVTNESNILIRYIFHLFKLEPKQEPVTNPEDEDEEKSIDTRQYNAGRLIGILERVIVYALVLNAQYGAIGLILAAKSVTRFKDLEKREMAEYVLIGTLLSTLLAMVAGWLVATILP